MRALRVVGVTENGDVVLEDPARRERFPVPADERLRAAARGDMTRLGQIASETESQLRPREIQARIRAGASVEEVAAVAGMPIQKVERFAYPVLLERLRTAELAQQAHPVRADGPDTRTLAEVVAHTFSLRGQDYESAEWDSWKGEDGKWVVCLSWRAGCSDNRAHWSFQPGAHGGTVTALDEHAEDLVEGLPARPPRPIGPVIDMTRPEALEQAPPSRVDRRGAGSPARERVAPPPEPPSYEVERSARRSSAPEPSPPPAAPPVPRQPERPAGQHAESRPRQRPEARPEPEPAVATSAAEPAAPAPEVAERQPAESPEKPAPPKRTKKGKPVMPSWDEVLLGVRGQR